MVGCACFVGLVVVLCWLLVVFLVSLNRIVCACFVGLMVVAFSCCCYCVSYFVLVVVCAVYFLLVC